MILVIRSSDKLEEVKDLCLKIAPPGTEVKVKVLDFSKADIKDYQNIFSEDLGSDKTLRLLVNNVGVIDK